MSAASVPGRRFWKRALLLFAAGLAVSLLLTAFRGKPEGAFLSDLLFCAGSAYLIAGLWGWLKNLGAFNSLVYGTRSLLRMYRGRRETPRDKMAGGYLEYVQSRPRDKDAPWLTAFASVFLLLSALAALTAP